ncbi:MAG: carbohydrate binding domain-containing protein [Candidatus Binatia bacterium]
MRVLFLAAAAMLGALLSGPASAANIVANPGFEDTDVSNWVPFANAAVLERSTDEAHDGNASMHVTGRSQSWGGPSQDLSAVLVPGTRYIVSVWVRMDDDTETRPTLSIKTVVGGSTDYATVDAVTTTHTRWIKLAGVHPHDPSGTPSEVILYVHGPAAGMNFRVDDVSVQEVPAWVATPSTPADFVRRSGPGLVVGPGDTPIRLRGVNFVAYGDESEDAEVVLRDHDFDPEVDFRRVADLGGNVVRLNLWWKVFEDAAAPYTWKEEGWAWLERILVEARAAGVRLILDMHAPQGGFQGPGYEGPYWNSPSLQARHEALLVALATRYRDEPWIAAWDILNEPMPPDDATWRSRAAELVDAVRAVDPNHLLIVEQSMASDYGPFLLADPGVVYEFHWYERWRWVSQLSYPSAWGDYGITYPDAEATVPPWDDVAGALQPSAPATPGTSGWTWVEGAPFTVNDSEVYGGVPVLWGTSMGGRLWADDFVVEEVDTNGDVLHTLTSIDIEKPPTQWWTLTEYEPLHSFTSDWSGSALSGSGSWGVESSGHRGAASISLRGASGTFMVGAKKLLVALKQGHRYRVSGWMKSESMTGNGGLGLRLYELAPWETFTPFTKDHLAATFLSEGMTFYASAGVPVNIGEIGITPRNLVPERGGAQWLVDTFDLFDEHDVGYDYFDWHSSNFGAYTNAYGFPEPAGANQPLLDILAAQWGGPGIQNLIALAGPDLRVRIGEAVSLDGTTTVGTVDTWAWEQMTGSAVTLAGADSPSASFAAPPSAQELEFRLTVTGPGGSSEDTVSVSVVEPCPAMLDEAGCIEPREAALTIDERRPGSEKMKASWKGFVVATTRDDFGDPAAGASRYSVCLYADSVLAAEYFVDRAGERCGGKPCWKQAGTGWAYKDPAATEDGVRRLQAKPGSAGAGSAKALGQNNPAKGLSSLPTGVASLLSAATGVTAQLRVDDGTCVTTAMNIARAREPDIYSAGR